MSKKKDILKEILNDSDSEECAEAKELIEFIESMGKQFVELPKAQVDKDSRNKKGDERLKRTYYLKKDIIKLLSLAREKCMEIKHTHKNLRSVRITKSKIVNLALEFLVDDFIKNGEESFLFKRLFQKTGD